MTSCWNQHIISHKPLQNREAAELHLEASKAREQAAFTSDLFTLWGEQEPGGSSTPSWAQQTPLGPSGLRCCQYTYVIKSVQGVPEAVTLTRVYVWSRGTWSLRHRRQTSAGLLFVRGQSRVLQLGVGQKTEPFKRLQCNLNLETCCWRSSKWAVKAKRSKMPAER